MAPLRQDDEGEFAIANIASSEDLEAAIVRRRTITQAVSTLSDNSRLLITLRDVEGLPYRDIATIVGVPIGTVESRIFRARRHLRPATGIADDGCPRLSVAGRTANTASHFGNISGT